METFSYVKAPSIDKALASANQAKFIAGGTTLVDLMKLSVETPKTLVDINLLPLDKIEKLPMAACESARWCEIQISRGMRTCRSPMPFCRRRFFPAHRRSCATWRPPAATCCSARDAHTSASQPPERQEATDATSVRPEPDARRSKGSIAHMQYSAPASIASRRILLTCAWPWPLWKR